MSSPRGLVVVRAGHGHRFEALLTLPRDTRSWDIALSFYDDCQPPSNAIVEWVHRCPGGKWDGIWRFFYEHGEALNGYDYYWLVDDDIEINAECIDALFSYVRTGLLQLAQPALTWDSYFSHRLTLACPGFLHRNTNLVEVMAPVLSTKLLATLLPLFRDTRSGFGLDWYWQTLVPEPAREIAIIDSLKVRHARPLRRNLRGAMQREGITPEHERDNLVRAYGLKCLHGIATGGTTSDGQRIEGRTRLALHMIFSYWRVRRQISRRDWAFRETAMLLYRQLFSPLGYKH